MSAADKEMLDRWMKQRDRRDAFLSVLAGVVGAIGFYLFLLLVYPAPGDIFVIVMRVLGSLVGGFVTGVWTLMRLGRKTTAFFIALAKEMDKNTQQVDAEV